jgi:hypothetical protein
VSSLQSPAGSLHIVDVEKAGYDVRIAGCHVARRAVNLETEEEYWMADWRSEALGRARLNSRREFIVNTSNWVRGTINERMMEAKNSVAQLEKAMAVL